MLRPKVLMEGYLSVRVFGRGDVLTFLDKPTHLVVSRFDTCERAHVNVCFVVLTSDEWTVEVSAVASTTLSILDRCLTISFKALGHGSTNDS